MTLIIAVIVILCIAIYEDRRKKKEFELKHNKKIIGYDTQTGIPLYEGEKVIGYNTQTGYPIINGREQPQVVKKEKQPIDKTKISNSVLMIIGAALVVFATVVFLTSSWDSIPNIIKPLILLFIQIVFFGSYKICTDKLDIPKTGKVFKYLSFMFLPIILISFSCFELIGEELSIGGKYASLYFMVSFIISDVVFKIYAKQANDMALKRTSYFMEVLAVLCLSYYIDQPYITTLLLSIFTTIIYILLHGNYLDKKAYEIINYVALTITMLIANWMAHNQTEFWYYLPFIIYTLLFFIMYFIKKDENEQKYCLYYFFINYLLTISFINILDVPKNFFYLVCLIPLLIFARYTKKDLVKNIFQWLIFAFTTVILISNLFNMDRSYYDTLTFLTGTIIYTLSAFFFTNNRGVYKCAAYLAFSLTLVNVCFRVEMEEAAKYVLIVVALLVYLLEKAFPSLQDKSSKHIIPIMLSIESIILGISTMAEEAEYTAIIPLILMIIYSKLEDINEEYILVPTFCTLSLFTKENTALNVTICTALVIIYSILSAIKGKINIYSFVSLLTIIIGLPMLDASAYITFTSLAMWSVMHYLMIPERKDIFKFTGIISILGLYIKIINDLNVEYYAIYFLGFYLALIAVSRLVFNQEAKESVLFEAFGFIILTILSLVVVQEEVDGILMIIVLFLISLFSFVNKYKVLLYCSLAAMIVHIIMRTLEFWQSLPIYIYVLIIGLTLIIFAMFDERLNIKKKKKQEEPLPEPAPVEETNPSKKGD